MPKTYNDLSVNGKSIVDALLNAKKTMHDAEVALAEFRSTYTPHSKIPFYSHETLANLDTKITLDELRQNGEEIKSREKILNKQYSRLLKAIDMAKDNAYQLFHGKVEPAQGVDAQSMLAFIAIAAGDKSNLTEPAYSDCAKRGPADHNMQTLIMLAQAFADKVPKPQLEFASNKKQAKL